MQLKVVLVLSIIAIVTVQGHYYLDEKDIACQEKTNVHKDVIATYSKGSGALLEDTPETEDFYMCRYGHLIGDDYKLIYNDETVAEIVNYELHHLRGNVKLANVLTKEMLRNCQDPEASSKEKAVVKIANCLLREFEEYQSECK